MHWPAPGTDSTPTEPGCYWYRKSKNDVSWVEEVDFMNGKLVTENAEPVADLGGEWVRVPEPAEYVDQYGQGASIGLGEHFRGDTDHDAPVLDG